MKNIATYISFILIILCSCNNKKYKSIEENLIGDSYKYWVYINVYPSFEVDSIFSTEEHIFIDYFDKNGRYLSFYKENINSEAERNYPPHDVIESDTWTLENDSLLVLNGVNFQIKRIEKNMMILYNPYSKRYSLYIAAPDSLIPVKYHRIQKDK
ncbi:hypothetical protein [Dysgonomonas sp.]|jgi:hypothetical protein